MTKQNNSSKTAIQELAEEIGEQAPSTVAVDIMPEQKWEDTPPPEVKIGRTDDIRRISTALAAAQGEMENAKKSSNNPHFKTSYAALDAVVDVIRLPLSRYQIARIQIPNFNDTETWLDTLLIHGPSGQYMSCRWPLPHGKNMKSQDFMAAVTYAKRGSIMAICGVAAEDEDDDGNSENSPTRAEDISQDQTQQPESKNLREAKQWTPWAIRKINQITSAKDLTDWEEKYKQTLIDLKRVFADGHEEVMTAIKAADDRIAAGPIDG